ncbi:response regulator [Thermodesulfobacteriota bacterium]
MARILLIEDDDQMRAMLRLMLERSGYDVAEAADGRVGINLYKASPADLIITDLIMPEKEGIETILALKQDYPELKIIAISGGGQVDPEAYLRMAQKAGALRTLAKPFERDDLLNTIKEVLD